MKQEKAIKVFRSGFNCAQSVLVAYADELQLDENLAIGLSCGFGGGMGRLQGTCGAVTGSIMVIGTNKCNEYTNNKDRKDGTYALVRKFNEKFIALNGSVNCKSLLNCDNTD